MVTRRELLLAFAAVKLGRSIEFIPGPVNAVLLGKGSGGSPFTPTQVARPNPCCSRIFAVTCAAPPLEHVQ